MITPAPSKVQCSSLEHLFFILTLTSTLSNQESIWITIKLTRVISKELRLTIKSRRVICIELRHTVCKVALLYLPSLLLMTCEWWFWKNNTTSLFWTKSSILQEYCYFNNDDNNDKKIFVKMSFVNCSDILRERE